MNRERVDLGAINRHDRHLAAALERDNARRADSVVRLVYMAAHQIAGIQGRNTATDGSVLN